MSNGNNFRYPGQMPPAPQTQRYEAQAAAPSRTGRPVGSGPRRPTRSAGGTNGNRSGMKLPPLPVAAPGPNDPDNEPRNRVAELDRGGMRLAERPRRAARVWDLAGLGRALGGTGERASFHARLACGVGGFVLWIVSGAITAGAMSSPDPAYYWLNWAVVGFFTLVELAFWYFRGKVVLEIAALLVMAIDIWFNVAAFHTAYHARLDVNDFKTWFYALLGLCFALFPEPLIKIAFKGEL